MTEKKKVVKKEKVVKKQEGIEVMFKLTLMGAKMPVQAFESDAGIDFYAREDFIIPAKGEAKHDTGVAWSIKGVPSELKAYMQIKSRSGLAFKHGIESTNAGVIDQEYRGNIGILLYNNSKHPYRIRAGERIAQGIIHTLPKIKIIQAENLEETIRGENGFGSTGK